MSEQGHIQDSTVAYGQIFKHLTRSGFAVLKNRGGVSLDQGISRARKVQSDSVLPKTVDVVVIGAGNIGSLTALTLVERGLKVVLCEKGSVAGESSGRSLGYIESLFSDRVKLEMVARAKVLWKDIDQRVQGPTGYVKTGSVTGFLSEEGLAAAEDWVNTVKDIEGIDGYIMTKTELKEKSYHWKEDFVGGLHQPSDACAEPQHFASSVAEAFRAKGGQLFQNCAVGEILTQAGKVIGVATELGEIKCHSVVLAGGAWTPYLAKSLGLDLPQFMAFASIARVGSSAIDLNRFEMNQKFPLISAESDIAVRYSSQNSVDICAPAVRLPITVNMLKNMPKLMQALVAMQGQFSPVFDINTLKFEYKNMHSYKANGLAPLQKYRVLVPEVFTPPLNDAIQRYTDYTADHQRTLQESWAGFLTTTPDHLPYLSQVDSISGLFIGSGFYNGLTVAPAAAEALADLVMQRTPKIDLSLFRFNRFMNGSPIIFRP